MAHFNRRNPAPEVLRQDDRLFRAAIRQDFRSTCAYCLIEEKWAAGIENFEIDHFRPRSLFPELALNFYNLYWACHPCNKLKGAKWPSETVRKIGIGFVDLCLSNFGEHFLERPNGEWVGKTLSANYTIDALRLNRSHLVQLRRELKKKLAR